VGCRIAHSDATDVANASPLVVRLATMSATARVFVPRLSIATSYASCTEGMNAISRSHCVAPAQPSPEVLDVAVRSAALLRKSADPDALQAAAVIDVLWGDSTGTSLARSIEYLNAAASTAADPASALSDLAAAELIRAERDGEPLALLAALDAAARASMLAPADPSARFNLALAAERLGLDTRADQEWTHYLSIDTVSGWALDARAHRRALRTRHVAAVPPAPVTIPGAQAIALGDAGIARTHGLTDELGLWGSAVQQRDTDTANRALASARVIGASLKSAGRDRSLADAVDDVDATNGNSARRTKLARAHAFYAAAQARLFMSDFPGAIVAFDSAMALAPADRPLRSWARVYRGGALVYADTSGKGLRELRAVSTSANAARYPALAGRAGWAMATTLLRSLHRPEGSLLADRAAALLAQIGERENSGAVNVLRTEERYIGGDERAAAHIALVATMQLQPYRGSVWLHNLLLSRAIAAEGEGRVAAAAVIRDEDAEVAAATGRPLYLLEARLEHARARALAGDRASAAADVATSRKILATISTADARHWFDLVAHVVAATAGLENQTPALDSAIAFFASRSVTQHVSALLARGRARIPVDLPAAERDLDTVLSVLSKPAAGMRQGERAALLSSARGIFAQTAMVHLHASDTVDALRVIERARASHGTSVTQIAAPPGTVVIDYLQVGDTLVTWTVDGTAVHATHSINSASSMRRVIARARSALELGADASAPLAELYDRLFRPVATRVPSGRTVVIVADDLLNDVPFAALLDTTRSRYFVEDHSQRVVSSLADARGVQGPAADGPALFIADPAFDHVRFLGFARLTGAAAEVQASAAHYRRPTVLEGAAATRATTQAMMASASLIHIAGHAVFNAARPEMSRLALATSGNDNGELTAAALAQMDLHRTKLVVLSACETMRATPTRSAAVSGFADALLGAGVGGVVGTLWRVDDVATSAVMQAFHARYSVTGNATASLRDAQLAMLSSPDSARRSPSAWGAFRYSGR
jgi:CHAT domain-containing protein/tetratricopeptide (TPR) repeat protein